MAEFASPGVISTERDFSATVQMLGTATGGTVINSKWGFADYEMIVANEDELVNLAGKPTDQNFRDWFAAANFLKYTSALRWVRVVDEVCGDSPRGGELGLQQPHQVNPERRFHPKKIQNRVIQVRSIADRCPSAATPAFARILHSPVYREVL